MISVRCPHCHVGLKVDETKIPSNIQTFNCPQCKESISVSLIFKKQQANDAETVMLPSSNSSSQLGKLKVIPNQFTHEQTILLNEGMNIVGRKSNLTNSSTTIETSDKLMSRNHILIEIKKDSKGHHKHYLSDNKSKNRTLYNSNYIESGEIVILKNKDEIQIGQTQIIFEE